MSCALKLVVAVFLVMVIHKGTAEVINGIFVIPKTTPATANPVGLAI